MKSAMPDSKTPESTPRTAKETVLLFSGGAAAGLIAFALFGALWRVDHFIWVMGATTVSCGVLALGFRQGFKKTLSVLIDNAPWI